jgi:hypothetical protein
MRVTHGLLTFVLAAGLTSCSATEAPGESSAPSARQSASANAPTAKVWLSSDGGIELNGKSASLAAVASAFEELAREQGTVLYGRERAREEPHPNAVKVLELIQQHRLAVRLSTKKDFSDAIGPDGKVR